jgi:hypothetical protein
VPTTSNFPDGEVVPIPTLPLLNITLPDVVSIALKFAAAVSVGSINKPLVRN